MTMASATISEARAREIQERMWCPEDFSNFRRELPVGVLSALLIQKGIRLSIINSGRARAHERQILAKWNRGESFVKIAKREGLLPLSIAFLLRQHLGFNKKSFQRAIVACTLPQPHHEDARRRRVMDELEEACMCDYLHSPLALDYMKFKGKRGEELARSVLAGRGIEFRTENEQDKKSKTPDFLFRKKEPLFGVEAHWLESKATFCNLSEAKEDWRTQLSHYLKLFGPGIVVYWLGYTDKGLEKLTDGGIRAMDGREIAALSDDNGTNKVQVDEMMNSGIELEPKGVRHHPDGFSKLSGAP